MIKIVEGDLLDATENIIGHQVNCQGIMGSGVAKQIREKYPGIYDAYKLYCYPWRKEKYLLLGDCQILAYENKIIANLFGQLNYGYDGKKYTNYDSLKSAFRKLNFFAVENNLTIALPYKIGCYRGGGDWNIVVGMIESIFKDLTLYKLEEKQNG